MPRRPKLVAAKPRNNKAKALKKLRLDLGLSRSALDRNIARHRQSLPDYKPREAFWWVTAGQNWHKVRSQPAGARECARRRKQMGVA